MNEMQVFENAQFGQIRTVNRDGEPWFVAVDVCRALDIGNSRMAVERLDEDEKAAVSLTDISSNGVSQRREMSIVNEPGLYALVLGSRKPEARAFKRWITHEVIPSIRKNGAYAIPGTACDAALKRAEAMLCNAKTRQFNAIMKAASDPRLSSVAAAVFGISAIEQMTDKPVGYRPETGRLYSATEIGRELGLKAGAIGALANKNGLKTEENGVYVIDKSPYSAKQVTAFRYNERGRAALRALCEAKSAT